MCPEYRDMAAGVKKMKGPLHRCMANSGRTVDDGLAYNVCTHNCEYQKCYDYQRKHPYGRPVQQNNTNTGSKSSGGGIFWFIAIVGIVIYTKMKGMW